MAFTAHVPLRPVPNARPRLTVRVSRVVPELVRLLQPSRAVNTMRTDSHTQRSEARNDMRPLLLSTLLLSLPAIAGAAPPAPLEQPGAIELRVTGDELTYTLDLSTLFDRKMWKALSKHPENEITIEVSLKNEQDQRLSSQYHRFRLREQRDGRLELVDDAAGPKAKPQTFKSRAAFLAALTKVRGQPIPVAKFGGTRGHVEVTALVNPVQVFQLPENDSPVADGELRPKTFFDHKVEVRSKTLTP